MNQFEAVVVGAGPAGSIAALTLARGGAHVALIDKARFPRDKACGDLIGPRGVGLLSKLRVRVEERKKVRDLRVIGFGGHEINRWRHTTDAYPDYASYVRRTDLDSTLFNEAVRAGAVPIHGRIGNSIRDDTGRLIGVSFDSGRALGAEFFIGADGSTTCLGQIANLVDPACGIWCFVIRTYLPSSLDTPYIILWDDKPWKGFPGYGWIFPDGTGWANVGVGIGVGPNRSQGSRAVLELDGFIDRMAHRGLIETVDSEDLPPRRLGGWLRMGLSGTRVAAGNILLAGDAPRETAPPFFTAPKRGVRRSVAAFRTSDLAKLERLLADDAVLEMTGTSSSYSGKATCVPFIAAQAIGRPRTGGCCPSMLPVGWAPAPTAKKATRPITRSRPSYRLRSRWPRDRRPAGTARKATAVRTDVPWTETGV